jgi:nucleotide-binding universal stress UspA family protein
VVESAVTECDPEVLMKFEDVLVPVDFSPNSLRAIEFALSLVEPDGEVYLLHVIDSDFVARLDSEGFAETEPATSRMRQRAEAHFQELITGLAENRPKVESMIVVGKPFAEILRVAADLDFQIIVIGTHGIRGEKIEELLFGSTAEKVLRGARVPVICVPDSVL